jgi:hypothetical protein
VGLPLREVILKSAAKLRRIFELRATFPKFFLFQGDKMLKRGGFGAKALGDYSSSGS